MERFILRAVLVIGLACLPFTFRKKRVKDWGLVFFATGYVVTFLAQMVVKGKKLKYTVRFFPKYFETNIVYEHLILPLFCVWFNQTTSRSKLPGIIGQALLYSGIHTLIEYFIEKKTQLVKWKKWTCLENVSSLTIVFLGSRGVQSLFKWLSKKYD
ncbi:CBO0543 family protein [Shouchella shacheensis]|uniref:CBO0543 family protein n=1 Tax=Shouchella shacheensis TaxID=1649580 RepID=UPI00074012FA|nr:CBO0543 family protein [Shouchella shacheensis]